MQTLRDILAALGCENVATYIQSGNAVFSSDIESRQLAGRISAEVNSCAGFEPFVLVLPGREFAAVAKANPFLDTSADSKSLHVWFLAEEASSADLGRMRAEQAKNERFHLSDRALYLHAPDGIGRSKLASNVEKCLGVPATARNWRTVSRIAEMLRKVG